VTVIYVCCADYRPEIRFEISLNFPRNRHI